MHKRCCATIIGCIVLVLSNSGLAAANECPAPTVRLGQQCVLQADAVLEQTLRLPSGTKLNCQGHRLTPMVAGELDDPRTAEIEFIPSQPDLAIFVQGAYGTKIQGCRIEGFDLGILVFRTKIPPDSTPGSVRSLGNEILDNVIDVRTNPIRLMKADHTLIAGNQLSYASEHGRGIVVEMDSDENRIVDNTITSTDQASTGLVSPLPGGLVAAAQTATMDNGIHCLLNSRPLQSFVIDAHLPESRELFQLASGLFEAAEFEDATRTDHNLIEDNTILDEGHGPSCAQEPGLSCSVNADCQPDLGPCLLKQNSGIAFNVRASHSVIRGNSIGGPGTMERGVSLGGIPAVFTVNPFFPGVCSDDLTRMCLDPTDCNIGGWDAVDLGPCLGASPITFNGNSFSLLAEDNLLTGTFRTAALFSNNVDGFSLRGNFVQGDGAIVSGIRSGGTAINGTIERNIVQGAANGLFLTQPPSGNLSVVVALNDFTEYGEAAIRTSNNYTAPTILDGNYWGLPCPGLDPTWVKFENGAINGAVSDVSYGVPVAETPDKLLPPSCP